MSEEEKKESIKVVDKRRFDEEGEPQSDVPDPEPRSNTPEPDPLAEQQQSEDPQAMTLDFSSFIMGFATQALIMLGEIPEPHTNEIAINLEGARQTIDAIALLEEKTKGNLSENEARLITETLAGLRMAYVSKLK